MQNKFSKRIASYVSSELEGAKLARSSGDSRLEFAHLERAHVVGQ